MLNCYLLHKCRHLIATIKDKWRFWQLAGYFSPYLTPHLEILPHELQVMALLLKMDSMRYKLDFHLYSNSIWILRPRMHPGHLSHPWPPFPQAEKKIQRVNQGARMKLGRRLHHVQVLQISRIPSLFSPTPPLETNGIILIRLRRFNS